MRRSRFKKFVLPLLVLGVLAAIGAASTNSLATTGNSTDPDLGYLSVASTGATMRDISYQTDDAGNLDGVTVTFDNPIQSNDLVSVATNGGTGSGGVDGTCSPTDVTTGTATPVATYTCTLGSPPAITAVTSLGVTVAPQ